MNIWKELQHNAWEAGRAAMDKVWTEVFNQEVWEKSNAYLEPVRTSILNGGASGGWTKFWACSNYSANFLTPFAQEAVKNGKLAFLHAYIDTLEAEKNMLYGVFRYCLMKARAVVKKEQKNVQDAIDAYIADIKNSMLARP